MENLNNDILSSHFTISEFVKSETAKRLGIDNTPSREVINNLKFGTTYILEPLRLMYGKPIIINSGYRCEKLNRAVGGVSNSYHLAGKAADIKLASNDEAEKLFQLLKKNKLVDVCLFEHASSSIWLHVQWRPEGNPRHHFNYNFKAYV